MTIERSSFKLRRKTVIGIKHATFFTICKKIDNGIHIYQFTFEFCTSVSGCGCGFGIEQKYWQIDGFGEKKAQIGGFANPYSPPSYF